MKTPRSRWDTVRFTLGMIQMAMATVSAVLLVATGVTRWSLLAAVLTCVCTSLSVLLFGARRGRKS